MIRINFINLVIKRILKSLKTREGILISLRLENIFWMSFLSLTQKVTTISQKHLNICLITIILWFKMDNETKQILKVLIENKEKSFSIRKLSIIRKINYKSAYNAIKKLNEQNLIAIENLGNTTNCSFNHNFNPLVFEAEYGRTKELLKNKDFMVIHRYLTELNTQFIALIFGSYAKNTQKKDSDIDILLISENPSKIEQELLLIPKNIHLTTVTPKEFILMAKSREFSVVQETIKNNIILIGIEDYYQVLKNAGLIKNKRIREEHTPISNRTINRKNK